jgi:hypothetical protein
MHSLYCTPLEKRKKYVDEFCYGKKKNAPLWREQGCMGENGTSESGTV